MQEWRKINERNKVTERERKKQEGRIEGERNTIIRGQRHGRREVKRKEKRNEVTKREKTRNREQEVKNRHIREERVAQKQREGEVQ